VNLRIEGYPRPLFTNGLFSITKSDQQLITPPTARQETHEETVDLLQNKSYNQQKFVEILI